MRSIEFPVGTPNCLQGIDGKEKINSGKIDPFGHYAQRKNLRKLLKRENNNATT